MTLEWVLRASLLACKEKIFQFREHPNTRASRDKRASPNSRSFQNENIYLYVDKVNSVSFNGFMLELKAAVVDT